MSVHLLEEMSTTALAALPRDRTIVILCVSPLEEHGPHLPLGVDAFTARYFAEDLARRLVETRPGWVAVLAPTLHLGTFTFDGVGTIAVRQRVLRDVVVDCGDSIARAGFRYVLIANGHGGPGHLVALEEAAEIVSRRHRITMASLSGRLVWDFMRGRLLGKIEASLGRALSEDERRAFTDDSHAGWWETSVMLMLKPHLVDGGYQDLPPARYSTARRLVPNYPLRNGGEGYVGHPSLADPSFARAGAEVLMAEGLAFANDLIDGRLRRGDWRSPFSTIPFFRTNFWPAVGAAAVAVACAATFWRSRPRPVPRPSGEETSR